MTLLNQNIHAPHLEPTGLETGLSEEERAILEGIRRFTKVVLHPAGGKRDRVSPEEMVAPDSILWDVLEPPKELRQGFTIRG